MGFSPTFYIDKSKNTELITKKNVLNLLLLFLIHIKNHIMVGIAVCILLFIDVDEKILYVLALRCLNLNMYMDEMPQIHTLIAM